MRKFNIFLVFLFVLLSIATVVYDYTLSFDFETFDFVSASGIVATVCILLAIIFAMIEKNYLAAIVISFIKITIGFSTRFFTRVPGFIASGNINFNDKNLYIGMASVVLMFLFVYLVYVILRDEAYTVESPSFKFIIWPFVVFIYYAIYIDTQDCFYTALAELMALILMAHISEFLLMIGAFIFIPFQAVSIYVSNSTTFTTSTIIELSIGGAILIIAIISLIFSLKNWLKSDTSKESSFGRISE